MFLTETRAAQMKKKHHPVGLERQITKYVTS